MEKRIDKIIKKAYCIKSYLQDNSKDAGNIDGLINSLTSYRDNIGDIKAEKLFTFGLKRNYYFSYRNYYKDLKVYTSAEPFWKAEWEDYAPNLIGIKAIEFTAYIASKVLPDYHISSMPPVYMEEHIADPVFDVQNFKVDVMLSTELINAGFRPTKTNVEFVCDFE